MLPAVAQNQPPQGVLPNEVRAQQIRDLRWSMFICWSFSTFSGREWTPPQGKDASYFKTTGVDTVTSRGCEANWAMPVESSNSNNYYWCNRPSL